MDNYLNLSQAADLLAELTKNPRIEDDIVRIIMLGADGGIPIFWRNSLHVWTRISSQVELLPKEELEPLPGTEAAPSWLQIPQMVLCNLEIDQQTQCWTFEIDEEDCYSFIEKGETLCTDLGLGKWFRHPVDLEDVTIHRNQLFVVEQHLRKYAAELSPTKTPKAADVDQVPSTSPLKTNEIAGCFAGLRDWDYKRWQDELGSPDKWLKACQHYNGQRGVDQSTWWPVAIGAALVKKFKVPAHQVSARFKSQKPLNPWCNIWAHQDPDSFYPPD